MASYHYYYDGYIIIGELRAVEVMLDMLRQQTSFSETSKKFFGLIFSKGIQVRTSFTYVIMYRAGVTF